jgi:hypothetical protein
MNCMPPTKLVEKYLILNITHSNLVHLNATVDCEYELTLNDGILCCHLFVRIYTNSESILSDVNLYLDT